MEIRNFTNLLIGFRPLWLNDVTRFARTVSELRNEGRQKMPAAKLLGTC